MPTVHTSLRNETSESEDLGSLSEFYQRGSYVQWPRSIQAAIFNL